MKQTVDFQSFRDTFRAYDRLDNFSRQGLEILFDYLEQYEQDTGEEMELDVIAFCCDFSEQTWQAIAADYLIELDENENEEEQQEQVRAYLENEGALIGEVAGGFVYRNF
jgi:hypothetical protein